MRCGLGRGVLFSSPSPSSYLCVLDVLVHGDHPVVRRVHLHKVGFEQVLHRLERVGVGRLVDRGDLERGTGTRRLLTYAHPLRLVLGEEVLARAGADLNRLSADFEAFRAPDGGYARSHAARAGSTYCTFLVAVCYELLGEQPPNRDVLVDFALSRRRADGGFVLTVMRQEDIKHGVLPTLVFTCQQYTKTGLVWPGFSGPIRPWRVHFEIAGRRHARGPRPRPKEEEH